MRIALAGVGHWHAGLHAAATRAAGAEVAAVWDPDADVARRFAATTATTVLADLTALIATAPDLVVCMGRPETVRAAAIAALDAGLPIVLEKPAAARADDLEPFAARARAGAFIAVPLPNRLGPIWLEAARLIAAGRLGVVSHASFRLINGPPERYRLDGVPWLLDPAIGGGGALRNLGIHGVDAVRQLAGLTGDELRLVAARTGRIHGEPVEDYAHLTFALGAAVVTVETGYTYASLAPGGDFEWRLSTANAYLVDRGQSAEAVTLDDAARRALRPAPAGGRYDLFMAGTLDALRSGRPPSVGIADYVAAMRLIDTAYAMAAATGETA